MKFIKKTSFQHYKPSTIKYVLHVCINIFSMVLSYTKIMENEVQLLTLKIFPKEESDVSSPKSRFQYVTNFFHTMLIA